MSRKLVHSPAFCVTAAINQKLNVLNCLYNERLYPVLIYNRLSNLFQLLQILYYNQPSYIYQWSFMFE